jgi:hypothetical protein
MQTGVYFVGNFVQAAAEQADRTTQAQPRTAAAGTAMFDLEAVPDEKIFGQVLGIF